MALAIGKSADESMMKKFINGTGNELQYAYDADEIQSFFKFVTMSITTKTRKATEITKTIKDVKNTVNDNPDNDDNDDNDW